MIEMRLEADDVAQTSFVISPLQETVGSLRAWLIPDAQTFHLPWRREVARHWASLDTEMLTALVAPGSGWIPDFLTPRPQQPAPGFADELAVVADTPWRTVRTEIAAAYAATPLPTCLTGPPTRIRDRAVAAIEDYHRVCIAARWPRMRAVLEGDIAFRGRTLADRGAGTLFAELHDSISWRAGVLRIHRTLPGNEVIRVDVAGQRLMLSPSLFWPRVANFIDPAGGQPMIVYPARGRGAVWDDTVPPPDEAITALLGEPRARILTMLREPRSTTDLAGRLDVTASAVSQHLRVLRAARLVTRTPAGRSVLYLRTELAHSLLHDVAQAAEA